MIKGIIIIEGHVQGLSNARSASEMGLPVWVMHNGSCIAKHSTSCSKFYQCSPYQSEEFIKELVHLGKENELRNWLLIPSNDYAVLNLSKHKNELSPFYVAFLSDFYTLESIVNKKRLLTLAKGKGIYIPKTYSLRSLEEIKKTKISFPVVTKGVIGQDFYKNVGRKAVISNSKEEFNNNIHYISEKIELKETFTQELISNKNSDHNTTLSVCCFCVNGNVLNIWMGEKLNQHPVTFGTATLTRSIICKELGEPSKRLISELKYTGICEIEWLYNSKQEQYNLIEINPRSWLWIELAKASGMNFIKDMIDHLNQEKIEQNRKYETNVYWYNPITYYPYKVIAVIKGIPSYRPEGKVVNALFKKGDNKPGWAYLWTLFKIFKSR